jgi:predicted cobalt transporter CbtA
VRSGGSALSPSLRHGLLAGLAAGVLLGIFHLLFSEPLIDRALRLEEKAAGTAELFSRGDQQVGLVIASALYGAALGGIFGFVWFLLAGRISGGTIWERSLKLALIGFATLWLVPFLKYPANPPAVGSPDTINLRTASYVGMIAISIAATALAWETARRLSRSQPHVRQSAAAAEYLVVVGLAYWLLPAGANSDAIPSGLLWSFRLASAAGQVLLWLAVGAMFALITMRRKQSSAAAVARAPAEGRST